MIRAIATPISTPCTEANFDMRLSMALIQCTSFSTSKKYFMPTISRNVPPNAAIPVCESDITRAYSSGCQIASFSADIGSVHIATATMASGKMMRMPKTAMIMPQVRKRCCHSGVMSRKMRALTIALSKESEISRTLRTAQMMKTETIPQKCRSFRNRAKRHLRDPIR